MRGFLVMAVSLAALDLVLQSPAARVAGALALPSRWLAQWMSSAVPLVPDKAGTTTTAAGTPPATLL